MRLTVSKFIALGIAVFYVVRLAERDDADGSSILASCVVLLFILALIWFPEQVGDFTGYVGRGGNIDSETPAVLVSLAGWFFLVGMPVLTWWFSR